MLVWFWPSMALAVVVGVGRRRLGTGAAQEHQLVVVGHQHQAHGQLLLVHAHHAVHGGYLAGHHAGHGVALGHGVFGGGGQGQAVGAQLRAAGRKRGRGATGGGSLAPAEAFCSAAVGCEAARAWLRQSPRGSCRCL